MIAVVVADEVISFVVKQRLERMPSLFDWTRLEKRILDDHDKEWVIVEKTSELLVQTEQHENEYCRALMAFYICLNRAERGCAGSFPALYPAARSVSIRQVVDEPIVIQDDRVDGWQTGSMDQSHHSRSYPIHESGLPADQIF